MAEQDVIIEHPNRENATSKSTRAVVIFLLLVTAALMAIILAGGWGEMAGYATAAIVFIIIDLVFAFYVARWNRGVLPVAAGLAIIILIYAAIATPGWFDRDAFGFADSSIPADVLGILCAVLVPVQVLLIAFAMRGFNQAWNVEVERYTDAPPHAPQTA